MKRIAVVEDNPDNRLLVRVILEPLYEVAEFEDGFAALSGLSEQAPDLVLLDVSLPGMDGTEVLRRMREDARLRYLPVIALTAHAMTGDRERFLGQGFDDYVTKPIVDENILLGAIQTLLRRDPAPVPTPTFAPIAVEQDALARLCQLGGAKFAREIIDLFLDYSTAKLAEAKRALETSDLRGFAQAVHPLKSSAGNVGASQVLALAQQLEQAAKAGQADVLAAGLAELDAALATARAELIAARQRLPEAPGTGTNPPSPCPNGGTTP